MAAPCHQAPPRRARAFNSDSDFFSAADYGLVAHLFTAVPELVSTL